ncbi:MAG: hypothetical protein ACT4QD_18045 [Acidobacteriota bacterium]
MKTHPYQVGIEAGSGLVFQPSAERVSDTRRATSAPAFTDDVVRIGNGHDAGAQRNA